MEKNSIKDLSGFIRAVVDGFKDVCSYSKNATEFSYRGISNVKHQLIPGIYRSNKEGGDLYCETESKILSDYIKRGCGYIKNIAQNDYLSWLEYAQHFRAPTRLLDFTTNPLIALFFACNNNDGDDSDDGVVWILNNVNYKTFLENKSQYIKSKSLNNESLIMEDIIQNLLFNKKCIEFPYHYEPYYIDQRMSAQTSRFLIWGNNRRSLEDLIGASNITDLADTNRILSTDFEYKVLYYTTVAKEFKKDILLQLDICGINEMSLFPGLDGVGRYIKNAYSMTNKDHIDRYERLMKMNYNTSKTKQ